MVFFPSIIMLLDMEVIPKTGSGFNAFSFATFAFDFSKKPRRSNSSASFANAVLCTVGIKRLNFITPSWLVASCSKYEGASHTKLSASVALVSPRWWSRRPWLCHLLHTLLQFQSANRGFDQNEDLLSLGFREILVIGLPIQPLLLERRQIRAHFVLQLFQSDHNHQTFHQQSNSFCQTVDLGLLRLLRVTLKFDVMSFLHGSDFATFARLLAHLSVRRHDTLFGVFCSVLHGPGRVHVAILLLKASFSMSRHAPRCLFLHLGGQSLSLRVSSFLLGGNTIKWHSAVGWPVS